MLRTTCRVIPAESLPRTRSGAGIHCPAARPMLRTTYYVIPAEAGIHCPAARPMLRSACRVIPAEAGIHCPAARPMLPMDYSAGS